MRTAQVCRLRLDFEQFSLAGPVVDDFEDVSDGVVRNLHSMVGQCVEDSLAVAGGEGPSPPLLCGQLAGQHLYTRCGPAPPPASLGPGGATVSLQLGDSPARRQVTASSN
jgi:hypothetical protein